MEPPLVWDMINHIYDNKNEIPCPDVMFECFA